MATQQIRASTQVIAGTIFDAQIASAAAITSTKLASWSASRNANSNYLINLLDPVNPQDGATKGYVDNVAQGLSVKKECRIATTANLSGTYTNTGGTAGTGQFTGMSNGAIDGVTPAAGDRILLKNQTAGAQNGLYCLDEETKILTENGWKKFDEVVVGELCFSFNIDSQKSEWTPVQSIHVFDTDNVDMLELRSRKHRSLSTLNHRWPVRTSHYPGQGYKFNGKFYQFKESKDLKNSDSIILAADYDAPQKKIYSDDFVALVAWFATEGHIRKNNSGSLSSCVRIFQSNSANPEKVKMIRQTLINLFGEETEKLKRVKYGIHVPEWSEKPNGNNMIRFDLNSIAGKMLCDIAPRRVPKFEFIKSLTNSQLDIFVDVCILGDGSINECINNKRTFTQKSFEMTTIFQMACAMSGIPTTLLKSSEKNRYGGVVNVVSLNVKRFCQPNIKHRSTNKIIKYSGKVWCPKTANSTWFANKEGYCFFTGNTITTLGSGSSGVWDRTLDFDDQNDVGTQGMFTFIEEGTVNASSGWVLSTAGPITIGTASGTSLTYVQFSGAGAITAGAGLTKTGNTIDVIAGDGSILVNADELHVQISGTTLATVAGGLKVDTNGITSNELAASSVTAAKIATSAVNKGITGGAGTALALNWKHEVPTGSINSSNTSFTLSSTPASIYTSVTVSTLVHLNGLMLIPTTHYSVSGTTLTMVDAPTTGDDLRVLYFI